MEPIQLLLLADTTLLVLGTPILLYFRGKMSRSRNKHSNYSKKRVIKVTLLNIIVHFIALVQFVTLFFLLIISAKRFEVEYLVISILLFVINTLIFYGGGVYITSIVLEAYTIPELTKSEFFKTQLLAIKMFHHPISHVLVFSGGLFAMLMLTFLDIAIGYTTPIDIPLLIFAGFLAGVFYAYSQIHNGTAIFHLPAGLLCLILLLSNIYIRGITFYSTTMGTYITPFLFMFNLTLIIYLFSLKKRNKKLIRPLAEIHPIT